MTDARNIAEAPHELDTPPAGLELPWPTAFELETKARLNDIESHLLRIDRMLIETQGDVRRLERRFAEALGRIEAQLSSLVAMTRASGGNGHG